MSFLPFAGLAPDADPTTPGVFTDCSHVIPTLKGFAAASSPVSVGLPALASACIGAATLTRLDGVKRTIAGTSTGLYEASGSSWTTVTRVAGAYTPTADIRWRFAEFGNITLATNYADVMQYSTAVGGAFADIAGGIKAKIVFTVANFVMAMNTNDTRGAIADGWACSALADYTNWTPALATQSANGQFFSAPGEVRAGRALGNYAVAYKEQAIFLGQYVGPPVIWDWQQIPGTVGALSQECVVDIGAAHVFLGKDDFWMFDGSRPVSIGGPVRQWFFANSNPAFLYKTQGYFDRQNYRVYWYFCGSGSSTLDSCLVYNTQTNKWGRDDNQIESVIEYIAPGITYDTFSSLGGTWDALPTSIAYDSPVFMTSSSSPAFIDTTHTVVARTGIPLTSSITTGDFGDDTQRTLLRRVRPRFLTAPTTGTLSHFYKDNEGTGLSTGPVATLDRGKFDLLQEARWHRAQFAFTGPMEVTGFDPDVVPVGLE